MAEVRARGLTKTFGAARVIAGVDLDVADGELCVLLGPSGCGKSTLLRMVAGLEDITEGELRIGGRVVNDLPPKDRGVAMVFQSYAIFPHMTVRENVAFGLTIAGAPRAEKDAKVAEAARILQMEHLLSRRPAQLSGGQRQRVAIGRAIVRQPSVFLFDEPLSNLDASLRADMRLEIAKLHRTLGATMIYVTHDQVEAMTLADRVIVLRAGEVVQAGPPMELYHRPASRFVAGFIGSPRMNFLDVEVRATSAGEALVAGPALDPVAVPARLPGVAASGRAWLGVRPQHLAPVAGGEVGTVGDGRLCGEVVLAERLGAETVVELRLADGGRVVSVLPRDVSLTPGEPLTLAFRPSEAHLFPP